MEAQTHAEEQVWIRKWVRVIAIKKICKWMKICSSGFFRFSMWNGFQTEMVRGIEIWSLPGLRCGHPQIKFFFFFFWRCSKVSQLIFLNECLTFFEEWCPKLRRKALTFNAAHLQFWEEQERESSSTEVNRRIKQAFYSCITKKKYKIRILHILTLSFFLYHNFIK